MKYIKIALILITSVLLVSGYSYQSRADKLRSWFGKYNSRLVEYADEFIQVADEFGLDWRLLPAIATQESGCGTTGIPGNNNPFGYGSDGIKFCSIKASIWLVGWRLAYGEYYYGKSLEEKLYTYNQNEGYAQKIKSIMRMISVRS